MLLIRQTDIPFKGFTWRSLLRMRPIGGKDPSSCWCLMSQDFAAWSSSESIKMKARDWEKDFNTKAVSLQDQQTTREKNQSKENGMTNPPSLWQYSIYVRYVIFLLVFDQVQRKPWKLCVTHYDMNLLFEFLLIFYKEFFFKCVNQIKSNQINL